MIQHTDLNRYRPWFYTAALYNLLWGGFNILFPHLYFDWIGIPRPNYLPLWQVVGMFVLVYTPAYWWAAQNPQQHYHFIIIGLLGKLLGPIGFVWSLTTGQLPLAFGWTLLLNDLIWWPAFIYYLRDVYKVDTKLQTIILKGKSSQSPQQ